MSSTVRCTNCYADIPASEMRSTVQDEGKTWKYCTLCGATYEAHLKEIDNPDRHERKEKVRVIGLPVRYENRRYFVGEEVYIEPECFDENLFVRI